MKTAKISFDNKEKKFRVDREGNFDILKDAIDSINQLEYNSLMIISEIGDEDANIIAEFLKNNTSLKHLELYKLTKGESAKGIADALKVNRTLESLVLIDNKIGAEDVKHIAEALKVNTTLKSINLSLNPIGDEGAKHIADALKVNTTLKKIILRVNSIEDKGAYNIAEALKKNKGLKCFDLSHNAIEEKGAKSIEEALKVNTSIISLDLSGNDKIEESTVQSIKKKCEGNQKKVVFGFLSALCFIIATAIIFPDSSAKLSFLKKMNKILRAVIVASSLGASGYFANKLLQKSPNQQSLNK